jgi:hypothetical protein
MTPIQERRKQLEQLDFSGKGEAFVESRFITPLLECLGYETHKDYEVFRHGDDGASFKLQYPPVEKGAVKVKHYHPDYVPTIRKKMFWIVEAKSAKEVPHPFDLKYLVQGLQYCIHPEIQAKYLLVSNGLMSSVFDAHGSVFLEKEMYEPILEFKASDLTSRWSEIYELLAVERLRTRIEADLKVMYDKLCLSSLDKNYPADLIRRIGADSHENAEKIAKTVNRLFVEGMNQETAEWRHVMETLDVDETFASMDHPMPPAHTHAHYFLDKCLKKGDTHADILQRLIHDFDRQSIFRKEQTFLAACMLYLRTEDSATKETAKAFLDRYGDADLPLLNQVECAFLRLTRKRNVLSVYPQLRERIAKDMESAPELIRFVQPPSAYSMSYATEIFQHHQTFEKLKQLPEQELQRLLDMLLLAEAEIQKDFKAARKKLPDSEKQILGFEIYGEGGRHYSFKGILHNYGIVPRADLVVAKVKP